MTNQDFITVVTLAKNHQTASKRTRNRINEAGPRFILEQESSQHRPNQILLRSLTTGWFGWLPLDEINILSKEQFPFGHQNQQAE